MKLIILSKTSYKEKDSIVSGINENEIITFLVKGLQSNKNKNAILNNPLIIADVQMREGNYRYPICESSLLLFSPYKNKDTLDKLAIISLISEATNKMLQDEEKPLIYPLLEKVLHILKEDSVPPMQIAITYLGQLLKIGGYNFSLNHCVFCEKKQEIVNFSFREGGFICKNCYEESNDYLFSKNQMLLLRQLLSNQTFMPIDNYDKDDAYIILKELANFVEEGLGVKLKSLSLIIN